MTKTCEGCNRNLSYCSSQHVCHKCEKILCSKCADEYPLIPFDSTKPDESNDIDKNCIVYTYCKKCFQDTSTLDFTKTYDIIDPISVSTTEENLPITFVMVHGGGACRAMFHPFATVLSQKGYRSVLLDLPGHGTMVDTPLTLDNCVDTVKRILQTHHLSKERTIYVGGSLGAYIGFYVLDKLKDCFCGAVLIDCGQNVGPDCSMKASLGIWFLRLLSKNMSNAGLMKVMVGVTKKSPADWKLIESTFGAGVFFDSAIDQTKCMHTVAPADHIPSYDFPVIFFNGSEDYRDSEEKWLSLCKHQDRSYLKVYEGGDHFFSHDSRFSQDLLDRIDKFAAQVASG